MKIEILFSISFQAESSSGLNKYSSRTVYFPKGALEVTFHIWFCGYDIIGRLSIFSVSYCI
jgi:hypothetical protein